MRLSLTLLFALCVAAAFGNPTFRKLTELNKCWAEQRDVNAIPFEQLTAASETDWIRLHLSLVEQTLRRRNVSALTPQQKTNRLKALDYLNEYWHAGAFPQNEEFSYRLPIFIDKYDNFCAVGYLVKATGYEVVSRKIQAQTNYAYVRDMTYPELFAWAREYGFTVSELAWIQPQYAPTYYCHLKPMGKATNGVVNELFVDTASQRLYLGGEFSAVDSAISANNIGYLTESNNVYTWATLGSGLNGPVHAIATYNNLVFAAGSFTASGATSLNNVAYWNGSAWQSAGCLNGIVKDLLVFQGDLYAVGQFAVCPSPTNVNFAKWTGSAWQGIPGLTGIVNTMEVNDADLLLGGAFSYNNHNENAIKWTTAGGFQSFANAIRNEVNDFEIFKDTIYAFCRHTAAADTTLIKKLYGNTWDSSASVNHSFKAHLTYNTACVLGDTFIAGGDFQYYSMTSNGMYGVYNSVTVTQSPYAFANWFVADSTVNKMIVFKNKIVAAGAFTSTPYGPSKGIAVRKTMYPSFSLTATGNATEACKGSDATAVVYTSGVAASPYTYKWSTGDSTPMATKLAPGVYTVVVSDYYNLLIDTVTITITQISFNKSLLFAGNVLSADTGYQQYQWYDCDNKLLLAGDTLAQFTPAKDGSYAAILTKNGCADTTICYAVVVTALKDIARASASIYPNPVNDELTIALKQTASTVSLTLTDVTGRVMCAQQHANINTIKMNTSALAKGVYILKLEENGKLSQFKLVKD